MFIRLNSGGRRFFQPFQRATQTINRRYAWLPTQQVLCFGNISHEDFLIAGSRRQAVINEAYADLAFQQLKKLQQR